MIKTQKHLYVYCVYTYYVRCLIQEGLDHTKRNIAQKDYGTIAGDADSSCHQSLPLQFVATMARPTEFRKGGRGVAQPRWRQDPP